MKILITGATSFVGGALVRALAANAAHSLIAAVRKPAPHLDHLAQCIEIASIDGNTSWTEALVGVDIIIHTAARVHVMRESTPDPP